MKYGWEEHVKQSFIDRVEIYDNKKVFDLALLKIFDMPETTTLPKTYSAALENRILMAVSPELYAYNFPEGIEEDSYEKLLAHEIAHRLHIRVLNGNEDEMGPIWFFEGFAIFAVDQFAKEKIDLDKEKIKKIILNPDRGDYREYRIPR